MAVARKSPDQLVDLRAGGILFDAPADHTARVVVLVDDPVAVGEQAALPLAGLGHGAQLAA
jgi:hypothetical protein